MSFLLLRDFLEFQRAFLARITTGLPAPDPLFGFCFSEEVVEDDTRKYSFAMTYFSFPISASLSLSHTLSLTNLVGNYKDVNTKEVTNENKLTPSFSSSPLPIFVFRIFLVTTKVYKVKKCNHGQRSASLQRMGTWRRQAVLKGGG